MHKKIIAVILASILLIYGASFDSDAGMISGKRWQGNTIYYYFTTIDSSTKSLVTSSASGWNSGLNARLVQGSSGINIDTVSDAGAGWEGLTQLYMSSGYYSYGYIWYNTTLMYKYKNGIAWFPYSSAQTKSIVYHELGHGIGLDENKNTGTSSVMEPYTTKRSLTPTQNDKKDVNGTYK